VPHGNSELIRVSLIHNIGSGIIVMHLLKDLGKHSVSAQIFLLVSALFVSGCTTIGPDSIPRDRFDYNTAISDSWKQQTLLNIVKIRYSDMPLFVEVASVVSGYTMQSSVNIAGTATNLPGGGGDLASLGASGTFTDRPTITYAPITGKTFNRNFMKPLPPESVMFLLQSGWAVDMILPLTIDSMNGLRGRVAGGAAQYAGDEEYDRVVQLFREMQKSGAFGMQIRKRDKEQDTTVLFFYKDKLSPELRALLKELGELLGLDMNAPELKVSYGLLPKEDNELALRTRSILQIMIALAADVQVPQAHVTDGRTVSTLRNANESKEYNAPLIDIKYSEDKPEYAFSAVRYREYWFYIDDRDFASKRAFAFLMILFSLTETGGGELLPIVTIPAG